MRTRESEKQLKPEIELLLCCARRGLDAAHAARLKAILQGSIDWELLFALATQSGLLPLLCEHLGPSSLLPPNFREANRQNAVRALFLTAELLRIIDRFSEKQLLALPYKGPVLSQMAYANPLLRQFDDLDFVVPQRFISSVYKEMARLGYQPKFQRVQSSGGADVHIPGEYVFVHKVNRAMVEVHTAGTLRHFPRLPNIEDMSRRSMEVTLNGRQISTFGWADTLLMLCVHGAKDFWSRLIWIADVAGIVDRLDAADWKRVLTEARKCDAERMLRLGLWLARAIFESKVPADILQNVERDRVAARIGSELRRRLLYQKKHPQGIVWRSRYRIGMVQSIWKGTSYWLRLSTTLAEEDWVAAPNARIRGVTYAFLRPLRLWRKYRRSVALNK